MTAHLQPGPPTCQKPVLVQNSTKEGAFQSSAQALCMHCDLYLLCLGRCPGFKVRSKPHIMSRVPPETWVAQAPSVALKSPWRFMPWAFWFNGKKNGYPWHCGSWWHLQGNAETPAVGVSDAACGGCGRDDLLPAPHPTSSFLYCNRSAQCSAHRLSSLPFSPGTQLLGLGLWVLS